MQAVAKRILVVEDNDLNRKLFCDVLSANGFDVEPIADGDQVLEAAKKNTPDLIIMDIQLPGISGVDLIQEAKKDKSLDCVPVLAVTAYAGKGDEERIRAAGAAGHRARRRPTHPLRRCHKYSTAWPPTRSRLAPVPT